MAGVALACHLLHACNASPLPVFVSCVLTVEAAAFRGRRRRADVLLGVRGEQLEQVGGTLPMKTENACILCAFFRVCVL
jgi:hypothetical protein